MRRSFISSPPPGESGGAGIGETVTDATEGSVLYAGASGVLAQDNADLFYDATNNRLQVGKTNSGYLQLGADYGAVGKRIYSLNDGNNVLNIGVPATLRFTDANGNSPWEIKPTGDFALDRTITAAATTGNQIINKPAGTVNIAAAGTSVTVTNSLVTTSSIIFTVLRTNDSATSIKNVVPGSGSFVINLTAGANAEVSIGFWVTN